MEDFLVYDALDQLIASVGLAKPKKGVFSSEVEYLIVLTASEIVILELHIVGDVILGNVSLKESAFALPSMGSPCDAWRPQGQAAFPRWRNGSILGWHTKSQPGALISLRAAVPPVDVSGWDLPFRPPVSRALVSQHHFHRRFRPPRTTRRYQSRSQQESAVHAYLKSTIALYSLSGPFAHVASVGVYAAAAVLMGIEPADGKKYSVQNTIYQRSQLIDRQADREQLRASLAISDRGNPIFSRLEDPAVAGVGARSAEAVSRSPVRIRTTIRAARRVLSHSQRIGEPSKLCRPDGVPPAQGHAVVSSMVCTRRRHAAGVATGTEDYASLLQSSGSSKRSAEQIVAYSSDLSMRNTVWRYAPLMAARK